MARTDDPLAASGKEWGAHAQYYGQRYAALHPKTYAELVETAGAIAKGSSVTARDVIQAIKLLHGDQGGAVLKRMSWGGPRRNAGRRPTPKEGHNKTVGFSLSPSTVAALRVRASELGWSRSKLVEEAIKRYLELDG